MTWAWYIIGLSQTDFTAWACSSEQEAVLGKSYKAGENENNQLLRFWKHKKTSKIIYNASVHPYLIYGDVARKYT